MGEALFLHRQVLSPYLSFDYPTLTHSFCNVLSLTHSVIYGCVLPRRAKKAKEVILSCQDIGRLEPQEDLRSQFWQPLLL